MFLHDARRQFRRNVPVAHFGLVDNLDLDDGLVLAQADAQTLKAILGERAAAGL